eukprot:138209_1
MGSCSVCSNTNDKTKHDMAKQETKNEFEKATHVQSTITTQNGQLYEQLRREWAIQSKCVVFSWVFKIWIHTYVIKIKNKNGDEILTVKHGNWDDYQGVRLERYSGNIQPIYVCDEKENNKNDKWTNLLTEEIINNSLYVTQNLVSNKENETRIKWNIGSIVSVFDYENYKWVKGKIINIFYKEVEREFGGKKRKIYKASSE